MQAIHRFTLQKFSGDRVNDLIPQMLLTTSFPAVLAPDLSTCSTSPSITWATAIFAFFFKKKKDNVDMPCHISCHLQLIHNGIFEQRLNHSHTNGFKTTTPSAGHQLIARQRFTVDIKCVIGTAEAIELSGRGTCICWNSVSSVEIPRIRWRYPPPMFLYLSQSPILTSESSVTSRTTQSVLSHVGPQIEYR